MKKRRGNYSYGTFFEGEIPYTVKKEAEKNPLTIVAFIGKVRRNLENHEKLLRLGGSTKKN